MLNFVFSEPVDLLDFTNGLLKELDKIAPEVTIKLTLKNNSNVTSMDTWVENKLDIQNSIKNVV